MLKKIINFVFDHKPVILIVVLFLVSYFLDFYNDNNIFFENLNFLFGLCILVTIIKAFDLARGSYTRGSVWFMVLVLALISGFLTTKIPEGGVFIGLLNVIVIIFCLASFFYLLLIPLRGIFWLIKKIPWKFVKRFVAYIERLLDPIYFFPIKLITYSAYYVIEFLIKLIIELSRITVDATKFPFKSFRNFLKSLLVVGVAVYMVASVFVIVDYIRTHYGYYGKFFCSAGTSEKMKKSVVRIVGSFSNGTGFFISDNQILTNFHVISNETSPKIIFPDGTFVTATKITGDKDADLALLTTEKKYPEMVRPLPEKEMDFKEEEPLLATGFPMGTDLVGKATVLKGNYIDFRKSKSAKVGYIQTNISLVAGMSGGPLTDQCGSVVGINTQGLAGLSLFISGNEARNLIYNFTDQEIKKIDVDPTKSPEAAVEAFYTYLSTRRMQDGFNLLSKEYLQKTNFEEWTKRFTDILDVYVYKAEKFEESKDIVSVKFDTKNWVNGEVEFHYYEGTWQTVLEDGKYKMLKSKIKEVVNPDANWFYE